MRNNDPVTNSNLIEQLAAIEHERWAGWMRYLFENCFEHRLTDAGTGKEFSTGGLCIRKSLVDHWQRQIDTPYADLSEAEKESDREQVERYIHLLQ